MSLSPYYKDMLLNLLPSTLYAAVHSGDVASSGNEIVSAGRQEVTLAPSSGGLRSLIGTPPLCTWIIPSNTIVASVAYWDDPTPGQGRIVWAYDIADETFGVMPGKANLFSGFISLGDMVG